MLCKSYSDLSHQQKVEFIGKLQHAIQVNENLFKMAEAIIEIAEEKDVLKGMEIKTEQHYENGLVSYDYVRTERGITQLPRLHKRLKLN